MVTPQGSQPTVPIHMMSPKSKSMKRKGTFNTNISSHSQSQPLAQKLMADLRATEPQITLLYNFLHSMQQAQHKLIQAVQ